MPYNNHVKYKNPEALIILSCVCVIIFSGCDNIYRLLHKEGAEEKEIVGEVIPLEVNQNIQEVQMLLELYGYDLGKADGILGRRTRDAIERFQEDNGLEPSRFVDQSTWQKLKIFIENGFVKEGKLNVKMLQSTLKAAGYDAGPVDGKFGPKTKEAVIAFQKAHNLKVDGKVGYQTLTMLSKYLKPAP